MRGLRLARVQPNRGTTFDAQETRKTRCRWNSIFNLSVVQSSVCFINMRLNCSTWQFIAFVILYWRSSICFYIYWFMRLLCYLVFVSVCLLWSSIYCVHVIVYGLYFLLYVDIHMYIDIHINSIFYIYTQRREE